VFSGSVKRHWLRLSCDKFCPPSLLTGYLAVLHALNDSDV
jgi:hypothetical protein